MISADQTLWGPASAAIQPPENPLNGAELRGVSKRFRVNAASTGRAVAALAPRWASRGTRRDLWALRDINLDIKRGQILGIVGTNGSGKSTLLRLITGISQPTEGSLRRAPRVAALLDLTAGFHPSLTGYENLFLGGSLMGIPRDEMRSVLAKIAEFSGIDHAFLEAPVRTYSSGMLTRLGFALAVNCDPDVVLVDEVLSVGDAAFQAKSARRLLDFRDEGRAMVLVSHLVSAIRQISSEVLWLDGGTIRQLGPPPEVTLAYEVETGNRVRARIAHDARTAESEGGGALATRTQIVAAPSDSGISIGTIELTDGEGKRPPKFVTREVLQAEFDIESRDTSVDADLLVIVSTKAGQLVDEFLVSECGMSLPREWKGRHRVRMRFEPLRLITGEYLLTVVVVGEGGGIESAKSAARDVEFEVETPFYSERYMADLPVKFEFA